MKKRFFFCLTLLFLLNIRSYSQTIGTSGVKDFKNILPERERVKVMNSWLEWRLDNIIPELMRREKIDMWIIICREYNEDPVYLSLIPQPGMAARRTSVLVFCYKEEDGSAERLTGSFYGMGKWYSSFYQDRKKDQFEVLAEFIEKSDPKKIAIDESEHWAFGDGLTASLKKKLTDNLDKKYSDRLVSAEKLCIGWLETRSPMELAVYRHICGIAHDIIAEFFSNKVIVPGITKTEDVMWWIRQKITCLGLETWFHPEVSIQRNAEETERYGRRDNVIRRGDLLHCDIGIVYLGLCTDTQEMAYVCKIGETDAPEGLKTALKKANRLQDILMSEFAEGRTGNQILLESLNKAKEEGLRPSIYTHPLGIHGHAAGPVIGLWDRQGGVPVQGDYPLFANTCYSIELNNVFPVAEWDGQDVRIALEEDAMFTVEGCNFIDGRQTAFFIIR